MNSKLKKPCGARANGPSPSGDKPRLDQLLVERGLAASREQAQARILAGEVFVNGQRRDKPGWRAPHDAHLHLKTAPRYASRAGDKLAAALSAFSIPVTGRVALDVGSSTGGFTDCLLQAGAARVHAVDSGRNQMIYRLRQDPRVRLRERTNARYLRPEQVGEPVDIIAVDVSFISATLLFPALLPLLAANGDLIVLVKPQFEAGREAVGKGGIVRDPAARDAAIARVRQALEAAGMRVRNVMPSPVLGAEGNQEFLMWARFGV